MKVRSKICLLEITPTELASVVLARLLSLNVASKDLEIDLRLQGETSLFECKLHFRNKIRFHCKLNDRIWPRLGTKEQTHAAILSPRCKARLTAIRKALCNRLVLSSPSLIASPSTPLDLHQSIFLGERHLIRRILTQWASKTSRKWSPTRLHC